MIEPHASDAVCHDAYIGIIIYFWLLIHYNVINSVMTESEGGE